MGDAGAAADPVEQHLGALAEPVDELLAIVSEVFCGTPNRPTPAPIPDTPDPSPVRPDGRPQQMHLDLCVDGVRSADDEVLALGGTLLKAADDLDSREGFQVYADPAGYPLCLCWDKPA